MSLLIQPIASNRGLISNRFDVNSRLKGAATGHSLLKKKADALTKRFRTILAKITDVTSFPPSPSWSKSKADDINNLGVRSIKAKSKMGRVMQIAAFSLAEVTYATGEIGYQIQESVTEATFRVATKQENVSGVVLPTFEPARTKSEAGARLIFVCMGFVALTGEVFVQGWD